VNKKAIEEEKEVKRSGKKRVRRDKKE